MSEEFAFICLGCTRYHFTHDQESDTCDAFPNGIPQEIINGAPHIEPWPGDGGLQFDAEPTAGDVISQYLAAWYKVEGTDQLSL